MTTLAIFLVGLLVTVVTFAAVVLVGLSEAGDPAHSRLSELSDFELNHTNRAAADPGEESSVDVTPGPRLASQ